MATVKLKRVFVALRIPDQAALALSEAARRQAGPRARLVAWQNLHITLAFFQEADAAQLAELGEQLPQLAAHLPPFLEVKAIAPFPASSSNLLAALVATAPALLSLHGAVIERATALGLAVDSDNPFRPHITLARAWHGGPGGTAAVSFPRRVEIRTLGIYRGEHTPRGYRYQCLFRTS